METKKEYIAPELTVVTFKTERGYAASNLAALSLLNQLIGLSTGNMQEWEFNENDETFNESTIHWS